MIQTTIIINWKKLTPIDDADNTTANIEAYLEKGKRENKLTYTITVDPVEVVE